MYAIEFSRGFAKDFRRIRQNPHFRESDFGHVVTILQSSENIPAKYKNHRLHGNLQNVWDIHVQNDIVLLYEKDETVRLIALLRIGTHSELF